MNLVISSPETDFYECEVCQKELSGKKVIECIDCSKYFCKLHIKRIDNDFSSVCHECTKKRIHLDISMEISSQIIEAKSELNSLKEKLKLSKQSLSSLDSKKKSLKSDLNSKTKSYQENIEKLTSQYLQAKSHSEKIIPIEEQLQVNFSALTDKFSEINKNFNKNERKKLEQKIELNLMKNEIIKLQEEVQDQSEKIKEYIPYLMFRKLACGTCKTKIKKQFSDDIMNGYQGKNSIIASVIYENEKRMSKKYTNEHARSSSARESISDKRPENDSCNCRVF
ncbi:hypothetical protein SteCoe_32525 [Stentor coeruleus]|uniref:Uncharacterized protein n=1 Tax=Stentor coeruleus TaxID=5963 RepID=A0A1R2AYS8_9CILI|nr:hypothetical protein SteCoe_32525 [Stentor coeruleus]